MNIKTGLISILCLAQAISCTKSPSENQQEIKERVLPGKVETYTYDRSIPWSNKYEVTINDETQKVFVTGEPEICIFGCTDTVAVKVNSTGARISSVVVRPLNKHPEYSVQGNTVTILMAPYDRYDVEINGNETDPLLLFANPVDNDKPDPNDPKVRYFKGGAVYNEGLISMKEGETLYLEGGAVVKGIINATSANNIKIAGSGILNGLGGDQKKVRLTNCNNVTLKDITVLGTTDWTTYLTCCNNITSDGYKVVATFSAKADGSGNENDAFDLLGCNHAVVKHGFSYCHDDAFCIKTQKWQVSGTTTDITFEDCIAWNKDCGNSFIVGYEVNQNVSNVLFKNCYSIHSAGAKNELRRGALSIDNAAGGTLTDIRFEDFYIEDPKEYGIHMRILKGSYDIGSGVEWKPGHIKGVRLKNVHIEKSPKNGNVIQGYGNDNKIEDVVIEDLYIAGKKVTSASDGYFNTMKYADVNFK